MTLTTEGGDLCACGCKRTVVQAATGRRRRYFEDACKSRAKRWRAGAPERARRAELQERQAAERKALIVAADELVARIPEDLFTDLVAHWNNVRGAVHRRANASGLLEYGRLPYSY